MEQLIPFISLVFLSAGLGIDNGLLIEFSIRSLGLDAKAHILWRSVALVLAAVLRIFFLFFLSQLAFLNEPMPQSSWYPNVWFSSHSDELTWMNLVLFAGGIIIICMALWEYYHKIRSSLKPKTSPEKKVVPISAAKILAVTLYLIFMNILFSVDSVFAAVAIMDIRSQFWWIVGAILIAAGIMIFGMIPISAIISKNKHFGVLMLTILAVIATKLMVDGTGEHFSNGLLIFIIAILLLNDAGQAAIDWAENKGLESASS